mmetsp:Transcript_77741/g.95239  ORF Transcript_77741/g.95239 Transcript_77741/m.95239 type:complete len:302 (-) Transcript_77741:186-1091(-)
MAQILSWLVYSIQLCIYYANIQLIATATSEVQPARRFQDGDRSNPKHRRMYVCMYQGTWLMLLSCYILSLCQHMVCYRYWIYMDGVFNKESCILYIWLYSRMIWILYVYDWFIRWFIMSILLVLLVIIYYIYYDDYKVILLLGSTYVEAEDLIYRSCICFTTFCGCSIDDMFNYIIIYIITHHIYIYTLCIQSYWINIRVNLHIMYPVLLDIVIFYYSTQWYTTLSSIISSAYDPVSRILLSTEHQGISGLLGLHVDIHPGAYYANIYIGSPLYKHILVTQTQKHTTLNNVSCQYDIRKYS